MKNGLIFICSRMPAAVVADVAALPVYGILACGMLKMQYNHSHYAFLNELNVLLRRKVSLVSPGCQLYQEHPELFENPVEIL